MSALPAQTDRRRPGLVRTTVGIIYKDLLLEWRGRARINATVFFAVLTLLVFSFAVGPQHRLLTRMAPGFLWLAVMLASVLSLAESMRHETDNSALEGLRLLPVDPRAIFLGKAVVNTSFLFGLATLLVPLLVVLYGTTIALGLTPLGLVVLLGAAAFSAPGTLYAAIAAHARARDVLLPLLLFPILVPGLLAAVKATELVMHGDPMDRLDSWIRLLMAFNLVYWLLCGMLFGRVVEE